MSIELSVDKVTPRNLTRVLDENGVELTRKERAALLAGLPETLTRRVKNLIAKAQGVAVVVTKPLAPAVSAVGKAVVGLFELIPGLSPGNKYRVIARLGAGFIAAKSFDSEFKVKFYPDFATFGQTEATLVGTGATPFTFKTRTGGGYGCGSSTSEGTLAQVYERYRISPKAFEKQFETFRAIPGIEIAGPENTQLLFAGAEPKAELQKPVSKPRAKSAQVKSSAKLAKKRKQAA